MTENRPLDPRWPRLLAAARAWKASLIPGTTTGTQGPVVRLLAAVEDFDPVCLHPRDQRVFYPESLLETCGKCGVTVSPSPPL